MEENTPEKSIYENWEADKADEDKGRTSPPEKREARAEHGLKIMDKINVPEVFSSEDGIRDFIRKTDFPDFMRLMVWVNGNLRGIPPKGREAEPQDIVAGDYVPPKVGDKPELMEETLAAMKRMSESGRPLEDIATMASICTNAIHYFGNANGRISRASYFLLRCPHPNFDAEKPILKTLLTERDGNNLFDLNSHSYGRYINNVIARDDLELDDRDPLVPSGFDQLPVHYGFEDFAKKLHQKNPNIGVEELRLAQELIFNREGSWGGHGFLAFAKFLKDKGELEKYREVHDGSPGVSSIKAVDTMASLSKEDIEQIYDNYWEIKRRFIGIMIDSIENPEKYVYDKEAEKPEYLYDILKAEVEHRSQRLKVAIDEVYKGKDEEPNPEDSEGRT